MTTAPTADPGSRRVRHSIGAILAALIANVALSLGVDQFFHIIEVYPPWGVPMEETSDNLLALSYRIIFGVLSGYIAARLASRAPMSHALILGAIGFVLSILGAIAAVQMQLGPIWYPVAVALIALPSAWLGGRIHQARAA